jgi:hypothetical protein
MIMKKKVLFLISVMLLSVVLNSNMAHAQVNKVKARLFVNRTNIVMKYAREMVKQNKVYTGNLIKASAHQKLARDLFKEGKFKMAVFHSHRARSLAFEAIRANRAKVKPEMEISAAERDLVKDIPVAAQLDAEVSIPEGATDESAVAERDQDVS